MLKKKSSRSTASFRRLLVLFLVGVGVHTTIANQAPSPNDVSSIKDPQVNQFSGKDHGSLSSNPNRRYPRRSGIRRVKRSDLSNLKSLLDRSSSLSRVVTGIHLQTGLQNGTIKIDTAIGELLNFGSLTTSNVGGFKGIKGFSDGIQKAMGALKTTGQDDVIRRLDQMMEDSEGVKKLDLDGKDADGYFTSVEGFPTNFDVAEFQSVANKFIKIQPQLDELKKISNPIDAAKADQDLDILRDLCRFIDDWDKPRMNKFLAHIKTFSSLETFPDVFNSYITLLDLLNRHANLPPLNQDISTNMDHLSTLISTSKTSNPEFQLLLRLIRSRSFPLESARDVTTGFIFGAVDLPKLLKDIQDPWFEKMIGNGKVQQMVNALKPLLSIETRLSEMDKKFALVTKDSGEAMSGIQMLQKELLKMNITKQEAENIVKALQSTNPTPDAYKTYGDIITSIKTLSTMISSVRKWAEHLVGTEFTQAIKSFNIDLNFSDRSDAAKSKLEIKKVMENLKVNNSIQKFRAALEKAQKLLNGYTGDGMSNTAASISKDTLAQFKDLQVVKDEMTFLQKLKGQRDGLKKLVDAVGLVQRIVSLDSRELTTLNSISGAISGASKDLQAGQLQAIAVNLKKEKNPDSEELLKMSGVQKLSKEVGEAVRGLQKILDFKDSDTDSELETLKRSMQEAFAKLADPEKTALENKFGSLDMEIGSVKAWIQNLNDVDSKVTVDSARNITGVGQSFVSLNNVGDVAAPRVEKIDVLDLLIPLLPKDASLQDKLRKSRSNLESMHNVDLHFSKFHGAFQSAPTSFNSMDLQFAKLFKSKNPNGLVLESSSFSAILSANEEDDTIILGLSLTWVGGIGSFIFVVLLAIIAFLCCFCISKCPLRVHLDARKARNKTVVTIEGGHGSKETEPLISNGSKAPAAAVAPAEKPVKKEGGEPKKEVKPAEVPGKGKEDANKGKPPSPPAPAPPALPDPPQPIPAAPSDSTHTAIEPESNAVLLEKAPRKVRDWINGGSHASNDKTIMYHKNYMLAIVVDTHKEMKLKDQESRACLPKEKWRSFPVNPAHIVKDLEYDGKKVTVHANEVPSKSGSMYIATQAPIDAEEAARNNDKVATDEDFWIMCLVKKAKNIVMLCNVMEPVIEPDMDEEQRAEVLKLQNKKCGVYFNENVGGHVTCGRFKITTESEDKSKLNGEVNIRRLKVEDTQKPAEQPFFITHYHILYWKDGNVPTYSPKVLLELLDMVKSEKKEEKEAPTVVHCSSGIGRTMVVIGLDVVTAEICDESSGIKTAHEAVLDLRCHRWRSIQVVRQAIYLYMGVTLALIKKYNLERGIFDRQWAPINGLTWMKLEGKVREEFFKGNKQGKPEHEVFVNW